MTIAIQWKNPPAAPKQEYKLADDTQQIIEALRSNPGEWALIKEDVNPNVTTSWKKRPGFEAKSSKIGKTNGKYDVYARYVGE
jgi:hypothetical protein